MKNECPLSTNPNQMFHPAILNRHMPPVYESSHFYSTHSGGVFRAFQICGMVDFGDSYRELRISIHNSKNEERKHGIAIYVSADTAGQKREMATDDGYY